ncbi:hypothetical protein AAG906_022477 [Vitis piasezkii]
MDDSKILDNDRIDKMDRGFVNDLDEFRNFSGKNDVNLGGFTNVLKLFLLKNVGHGVDTLFLARKFRETNTRRTCSCGRLWDGNGNGVEERRKKSEFSSQNNQKVCEEPEIKASQSSLFRYGSTSQRKEDCINVSKGVYHEFPLNFITFLAILLMKSLGFQIDLLVTFLTFPLYLSYFWFMLMMFPFQTLKHIRSYLMKKVTRMLDTLSTSATSFVFVRINAPKSVVKMAVRMSRAFLYSIYVCCVLIGLLVLVEEPVQATRTLNFDYTKGSPVAFVPMISHNLPSDLVAGVKVEFLSTNGKVTATQSHPCILRYKSQPIRHIQTFIKAGPLLAGFESESQTLNIKMAEFTEGLEPTACLKVSLVQRAEFQPGAGIPEIHAATVALERTILVWASFVLFLMELVLMLVIYRPIIIPRGRQQQARLVGIKEDSQPKAIAWYKGMVLMMIMA